MSSSSPSVLTFHHRPRIALACGRRSPLSPGHTLPSPSRTRAAVRGRRCVRLPCRAPAASATQKGPEAAHVSADRREGTSGNKGGGFRSLFLHVVLSLFFFLADRCFADADDLVIVSHLSFLTPISIPRRCVRVFREAAACGCANAAAAAPNCY